MHDFFINDPWAIAVEIAFCIVAYLFGAVNFATVISRAKGGDVRRVGSGNPGTMNMLRTFGKGWGALTFVLDCLKGVLCALAGKYIIGSDMWMFILGAVAVLGHVFPVYTKFKGGKGVATSLGIYLVANPIVAPIVLAALILALLFLKYGFIGSLTAITTLSVYSAVKYRASWVIITLNVLLIALIVFTHRGNIARLIKGKENTLFVKGRLSRGKDGKDSAEDENIRGKVMGDDCDKADSLNKDKVVKGSYKCAATEYKE